MSGEDSPAHSGSEAIVRLEDETTGTPAFVPRGTPVPRGGVRGRARSVNGLHANTPPVGRMNTYDSGEALNPESSVLVGGRAACDSSALGYARKC